MNGSSRTSQATIPAHRRFRQWLSEGLVQAHTMLGSAMRAEAMPMSPQLALVSSVPPAGTQTWTEASRASRVQLVLQLCAPFFSVLETQNHSGWYRVAYATALTA